MHLPRWCLSWNTSLQLLLFAQHRPVTRSVDLLTVGTLRYDGALKVFGALPAHSLYASTTRRSLQRRRPTMWTWSACSRRSSPHQRHHGVRVSGEIGTLPVHAHHAVQLHAVISAANAHHGKCMALCLMHQGVPVPEGIDAAVATFETQRTICSHAAQSYFKKAIFFRTTYRTSRSRLSTPAS